MQMVEQVTTTIKLSEDDLRAVLVEWAQAKYGIAFNPKLIDITFTGGHYEQDPYDGSSSYVRPIFGGVKLTKTASK